MTTIRFFVPERPFVKQRPRFGRGRTWTAPETREAEQAVRYYARAAMPRGFAPFAGPVRLELEFRFARPMTRQAGPVRESRWHFMARSGDLDNAVKLVLDALNPHRELGSYWPGMWVDDGQVASIRADKLWADDDHPEGTSVTVEAL